ncbi:hypothetical protein ACEN8K_46730, partial [Variovorax sp. CT11-76]
GRVGGFTRVGGSAGGVWRARSNAAALDPGFGPQIRLAPAHGEVRYALSNSFGFGGNNCALVFGKAAQA